jgi:hypothetical protein
MVAGNREHARRPGRKGSLSLNGEKAAGQFFQAAQTSDGFGQTVEAGLRLLFQRLVGRGDSGAFAGKGRCEKSAGHGISGKAISERRGRT